MNNIPVYNCLIEDLDETTGVYAISFVDYPANEVDFIMLNKQKNEMQLNRDDKKQILTGVVLKPEQLIYRNSPELGDYYIKFSANEIEKISHKMMRTGIALHSTTHQHSQSLAGNFLTELWIVSDPNTDKSKALGFNNLPKGTLMCSYKIDDTNYWNNEVMAGHVRGFSLEGFFNQQLDINYEKKQKCKKMNNMKKKPSLLSKIVRTLLDIEAVEKADTTQSGEAFVVFVLADGKEVYVDQDGFATLDEEQMPAGEHILADGNLLIVDDQGQFTETKQASEKAKNPDEATASQNLRKKSKNKRHRLTDSTTGIPQGLKEKITEMQTTIDELSKALNDALLMLESTQGQVEEMRKRTPSSRPAVQQSFMHKEAKDLTTAERMAYALSQTIQRK